jgi:ornithine cyclodeaminase
MARITILTEKELRQAVRLDRGAVEAVAAAFQALATQPVRMPPILRLDIPEHRGEMDVKTAYVPGIPSFALKVSPGFFDNPKLGLPSLNGLMILFSAATGLVEAVLLDNGYLTDIRTAAAGAVAADRLAAKDATRAGIIGAGVQARLQLEALTLVRPIGSALVWARDAGKATAFAAKASAELGLPVQAAGNIAALCAASDIVVTTTPSTTPLIAAAELHPGLHITAMGADSEHKNEIAPEALAKADLYVADRQSQCALLGELHHALAAGIVPAERRFPELGEIVAGRSPGRRAPGEVTIADLTGTGVQDTAIATLARRAAAEKGLGRIIES